jgi:hypothetical protein
MLAALQSTVLGPGVVTDGYRGLGMLLDADDLVVVFRWKRDLNNLRPAAARRFR